MVPSPAADLTIIAHRGASGYLPEHTLASKAMAHAMGADFLEQDVVLTKDDQAIVLHDIHLEAVTDVEQQFPDRTRDDGHWYAIDFTLDEIKLLRIHERTRHNSEQAVFVRRFPVGKPTFQIRTLAEEIELVQGLNKTTGRSTGIYPEIKKPAWHRSQKKDISQIVLNVLRHYEYDSAQSKVFVQCFDANELKRLRYELRTRLKLVQLIGENDWNDVSTTDFRHMISADGVAQVASYAQGIGPSLNHLIVKDESGQYVVGPLVKWARDNGLQVHPFTHRSDALPEFVNTEKQLFHFLVAAQVDGVFSDFPDRARKFWDEANKDTH